MKICCLLSVPNLGIDSEGGILTKFGFYFYFYKDGCIIEWSSEGQLLKLWGLTIAGCREKKLKFTVSMAIKALIPDIINGQSVHFWPIVRID